MPRFFVNPSQIRNEEIEISGQDAHHISSVLRLEPGDTVTICDGMGMDYECVLQSAKTSLVLACILGKTPSCAEPSLRISLFQGLPKGEKMELIIQKSVELGVYEIIPVITENTVAKLRPGREQGKTERWQRISEAASKQSGRGIIPKILPPVSLAQATAMAANLSFSVVAYEKERQRSLKEAFSCEQGDSMGVFIGPEGGFSEKEIGRLAAGNILPVSLGSRILRTETAGFAAILLSLYEKNEL